MAIGSPPEFAPSGSRWRDRLPKPEWGTKRTCLSCGSRFYDFGRSSVACPACGANFDLEALARARRPSRPSPRAAAAAAAIVADDDEAPADERETADADVAVDDDVDDAVEAEEEDDEVAEVEDGGDEDEEGLIEDASELGEDEDVADVIEGEIDGEEPR